MAASKFLVLSLSSIFSLNNSSTNFRSLASISLAKLALFVRSFMIDTGELTFVAAWVGDIDGIFIIGIMESERNHFAGNVNLRSSDQWQSASDSSEPDEVLESLSFYLFCDLNDS